MIKLRELEQADLPQLNSWRNDPELLASLGNNFLYISGAVDEAWFANYLSHRDKAIRLSIIADGHYIGNVNLTFIHPINRSAEFSIFIGSKDMRGKGYGKVATQQMLHHAFNDRGLRRVYLNVLSENVAAIALYKRVGFVCEGVMRDAVFKHGRFCDLQMMAMLADEYKV